MRGAGSTGGRKIGTCQFGRCEPVIGPEGGRVDRTAAAGSRDSPRRRRRAARWSRPAQPQPGGCILEPAGRARRARRAGGGGVAPRDRGGAGGRERAKIGTLLWRIENRFAHAGRRYRETGFYYRVELPAEACPLVDGEFESAEPHLRSRWFPLAELAQVDLRPAVVRVRVRTLRDFPHV